jgi:hypothetical protein
LPKTLEDVRTTLGEYFPALLDKADENDDVLTALTKALEALESGNFSLAKMNQVLHLCSQAGITRGFFRYYFLEVPDLHPYPVELVFSNRSYEPPAGADDIKSILQLQWGIRRFFYDAMLYWGNIRQAYRDLRVMRLEQITDYFAAKRSNEERLIKRGDFFHPYVIPQDNRYLISEMACKSYEGKSSFDNADHITLALEAFRDLNKAGASVKPSDFKDAAISLAKHKGQQGLFELLFEEPTSEMKSESEVVAAYAGQWKAFTEARDKALSNTRLYLSLCSDLDIYVATSMRTREDFREMARTCESIFEDDRLKKYHVRYFDPTLSAAEYHEDKGIIECLMVKTAKILLYFAQHKESLGKVSEYAMALSLGKPVIILCPDDPRGAELYGFYRDQHPLTRLIEFKTGIINGAMVTQSIEHVISLVERLLANRMEYNLETKEGSKGYYLLKERQTGTTVRVITDDKLLTETFWNNYHNVQ